jgi:hypothetical protein
MTGFEGESRLRFRFDVIFVVLALLGFSLSPSSHKMAAQPNGGAAANAQQQGGINWTRLLLMGFMYYYFFMGGQKTTTRTSFSFTFQLHLQLIYSFVIHCRIASLCLSI